MKWKNNDVVRWGYTDKRLKEVRDGNNGGTTYWCNSRIAIFNEDKGIFHDTYWSGSGGKVFSPDLVGVDYEVKLIANMGDLTSCNKADFNQYDDSDCVDLSHPNMSRGGFYIRSGATKSVDKIKKAIEAHIEYYQKEADYALREVSRLKESLINVTSETYAPAHPDVYIG